MIDVSNLINGLNISAALTLIALMLFFIILTKLPTKKSSKR